MFWTFSSLRELALLSERSFIDHVEKEQPVVWTLHRKFMEISDLTNLKIFTSLSYDVIFNEDPETNPCAAVHECFSEIERWENAFFTNQFACPSARIDKVITS